MIKKLKNKVLDIKEAGKGHFVKTLLTLAVPITLQNIASASLNFIDNIMVGQLGDVQIASVGLANQVYFVVMLFFLAVSGGASMFISQFWGRKDLENVRRVQGLSLLLICSACVLIVVPSVAFPRFILGILTGDNAVIELGSKFLRISSLSYILFGISTVYSVALRNTGHPKIPLIANFAAVITNTFLNYLLIFGNFGAPKLGVPGSAIATCTARVVECSIILITVYSHRWPSSAKLKELLDFRLNLVKNYFSQSGLLITKDVVWALGIFIYMTIYSRMGTSQVAAVNILSPVIQIATVVFSAIAVSCQIMVGNQLGADNKERAYKYAGRFMKIVFFGGIIMGLSLLSLRNLFLLPYRVSGVTAEAARNLIFVYSLYFPFIIFNMLTVVGVMRSGGDTVICLVMDLIAVYLIGLPMALLGAYIWRLPIYLVYPLVWSQELFKAVVMLTRYRSKKWLKDLTALSL